MAPRPVGLGGRIRERLDDFQVEELPLVRPEGRGEHVLFLVEKRGMSTFDAVLRVSKGAKVSEHAVGYAGLKDALRDIQRQNVHPLLRNRGLPAGTKTTLVCSMEVC